MSRSDDQYADGEDPLAVFDLHDRVQIELRGSDRLAFLNNFCTNNVLSLQPGTGCEAFLTNVKGRILGHVIVSADEDAVWLDSVPGSSEVITAHLDRYLITEDVQILDRTSEMGPLCMAGTGSFEWLSRHAPLEELPVWGQTATAIGGVSLIVRRVGFVCQPAFQLVVRHAEREQLLAMLNDEKIRSGNAQEFDALRIAAGFPHYGRDLSEENLAQEAARNEQAISFTKGCYLGQEPIARLDALGHTNRELRRLTLSSGPVPAAGVVVTSAEGVEAGRITSAAVHPAKAAPVALAMLKTAYTKPGTTLLVTSPNDAPAIEAEVL